MNVPLDFPSIAFLDIEASSLGSNSFPTEIGWAIISRGGFVESAACLIKPAGKWTLYENAWSLASEALTGITRQVLDRDGVSPAEAMERFLQAVGERELFSDAPDFDGHWLGMLADAAGVSPKQIIRNASALTEVVAGRPCSADTSFAQHRAGPDAQRLALAFVRRQSCKLL